MMIPTRAPAAARQLIVPALLILVAIVVPLLVGRAPTPAAPVPARLYVVDWPAVQDSGKTTEQSIASEIARIADNTVVVAVTDGRTDPCAVDPPLARNRYEKLCATLDKVKAITISPGGLPDGTGAFPTGILTGTGTTGPDLSTKALVGVFVSVPLLLLAGWLVGRPAGALAHKPGPPATAAPYPSQLPLPARTNTARSAAVAKPAAVPESTAPRRAARAVSSLLPVRPGDRVETVTHFRPAGGYVRAGSATVWARSPAGLPFRPGDQLRVRGWDPAGTELLVEPDGA